MSKPVKKKKCRECPVIFTPTKSTQVVCGWQCAVKHADRKKRVTPEATKWKREARVKAMTVSDYHRLTQSPVFNKWIRLRDRGRPCISCGTTTGQMHAGHYRSVGAEASLRYEPDNVHLQCSSCNNHLSGNPIPYRVNLILKIGLKRVEWLEGKHEPKKYTIDDVKAIAKKYRRKIKELT